MKIKRRFIGLLLATIIIISAIPTFAVQAKSSNSGWHHNKNGWWYTTSDGSYYKKCWKKIKGDWYYFKADGYMASNEYINGWYVQKDGKWDNTDQCNWKQIDGEWYWFFKNTLPFCYDYPDMEHYCWLTINGTKYCFDEKGKMYANMYIGTNSTGFVWINSRGTVTYKGLLNRQDKLTIENDWEIKGHTFKDTLGWVPRNKTYIMVDEFYGPRYSVTFDSNGKAIKTEYVEYK